MTRPSPWWDKPRHTDRRPLLLARARIKSAIRAHLEAQGFVEVETGVLQVSPGNETHLHAFATEQIGTGLERRRLFLHTSPEFACKKLLAAGETRIFTFAPVFRNRERGRLHHPEFTMLEWYRADEPYDAVMRDCAEFLRIAADVAGADVFRHGDRTCPAFLEPERLSVADAMRSRLGIDLLATLPDGRGNRDALAAAAEAAGIPVAADDTWSDVFSRSIVEIEPTLGIEAPTLLTEYPVCEAALARVSAHDARVAERFELYACGVELANGFGELTEADVQRRRFAEQMDEKQRRYGERYPVDEDFLAALAHMPPASGCALGFDRLVMLATGAPRIDDVIWTPMGEG
jgi:lysyl-tRNA synthetase class 2